MEGREVKTVVFFDIETTGLDKARITELCLLSVQREELTSTLRTPRVVNKVTLCVNPQKPIEPKAFQLTNLYNDNLEDQSPFDSSVVDTISSFLSRLPSPICLLAHNGNKFDFPILLDELKRARKSLPEDLLCADSLNGFKDLDDPEYRPQIEGSSSQPTSRVTTPLDPMFQSTDLSSSLNLSRRTPIGQLIPENSCLNIKERVRQLKRKCDSSFDRCPSEAKAVKKRLFQPEAEEAKEENTESASKSIPSSKPSTLEKLFSAKRFKPEVETVKKKLNFDSDDEESGYSSLNCSTDYEMIDNKSTESSDESDHKSQSTCAVVNKAKNSIPFSLVDSQGSLEDDELLSAVQKIENLQVPAFGMSDFDSPTYETSFTNVPTSSAICVTPKKGETTNVTNVQTTNETTPVKNTISVSSELKYTPVTQLTRCTEKVKLNTPKSSQINEELKKLSATASTSDHGNHLSSFSAFVTASYSNTTNSNSFSLRGRLSYSLPEIYKRLFGCSPAVSHTAEDDCKTLLQCVKRKSPDFIRWCDRNAILLTSIPPRC